jgi:hypothetical protein
MASIEKRPGNGKKIKYRVRWRLGGAAGGTWQSETFDEKAKAVTFKPAAEACGHLWPENWISSLGWAPITPDPEPEPEPDPPLPFGPYALDLIASLSGIEARTRHDYKRDLARHVLLTFADLDLRDNAAITSTMVTHRFARPTRPPQTTAPAR